MNIQKCIMPSFSVIGKEGSTNDRDKVEKEENGQPYLFFTIGRL